MNFLINSVIIFIITILNINFIYLDLYKYLNGFPFKKNKKKKYAKNIK